MNNLTLKTWFDHVFWPHIIGNADECGLLLDSFKCHWNSELLAFMDSDNQSQYMIPIHYMGLLQACDLSIYKTLKDRLEQYASEWRQIIMYHCLLEKKTLLLLEKMFLVSSNKFGRYFRNESWKNSFTRYGYFYETEFTKSESKRGEWFSKSVAYMNSHMIAWFFIFHGFIMKFCGYSFTRNTVLIWGYVRLLFSLFAFFRVRPYDKSTALMEWLHYTYKPT